MNSSKTESPFRAALRRYARLRPYLKAARLQLVIGVLAGLVFAAASGLGLPTMMLVVAPVIFEPTSATSQLAATNAPAVQATPNPAAPAAAAESTVQKQKYLIHLSTFLFGDSSRDSLLRTTCVLMPVIFLIRGLCSFLNKYFLSYGGFLMLEALRREVFGRLQQLPLAFYHRHKSGDLTSRLMTDTEQLKNVMVMLSTDVVTQPMTLISAIGFLLYQTFTNRSAVLVLIMFVSVPLCIIPIRLAARRIIKKARLLASQTGELTAVVSETLQSPMEIQAYNLQHLLMERFAANVRNILRLAMKTVKYQSFSSPVIEFVSACGFVVALYFGAKQGMDLKTFSAMGVALYMAYEPVKKLSIMNAVFKMGSASLERLEQVLNAPDSVPQAAAPVALPDGPAPVVFEQVSFTYERRAPTEASEPALDGVSAAFQPGEVVALVGHSGAGKSTFVAMIPRFYDPTGGRVLLGGVDLRHAHKTALRDRIALVPQMPALFNTTIAENIRMGRLTATDAEVKQAAQKAFVSDFIDTLPQGYDTMVGERGTSLSGGQRQRIAIARAFLRNAPILILDEAMSALDSESEAKVHQALAQLVQGRTTFMIAHRFSSLNLATRVLVFEGGKITGDGPREALLRTNAVFQRMTELQRLE